MLLYLVVSGETVSLGDHTGLDEQEASLSAVGVQQAGQIGGAMRGVPLTALWVGNEPRSLQTAETIAKVQPKVSTQIDPLLSSPETILKWLENLIKDHKPNQVPAGSPRTPITPTDPGCGIVLAITTQACLRALMTEITDKPNVLLNVHVPPAVDVTGELAPTSLSVLRVWWEESGDLDESGLMELDARGRVEAWGLIDHLEGDDV